MDRMVVICTGLLVILLGGCATTPPAGGEINSNHWDEIEGPVRKILPSGWSMTRQDNELLITRNREVVWINGVNLPPNWQENPEIMRNGFRQKYTVKLQVAPLLSLLEYRKLDEANGGLIRELEELENKMRHITHKFNVYIPDSPEGQALIDRYKRLCKVGHVLPRYFTKNHSIYRKIDFPEDVAIILPESVGKECNGMLAKLDGAFQRYPPSELSR